MVVHGLRRIDHEMSRTGYNPSRLIFDADLSSATSVCGWNSE